MPLALLVVTRPVEAGPAQVLLDEPAAAPGAGVTHVLLAGVSRADQPASAFEDPVDGPVVA